MKGTLLWAYASQAYISLIGIILMPVYLRYLGAESFGLVGVYLMLQAWIQVLDMGFTPVLSREMSRFRAGVLDADGALVRLQALEFVQSALALAAVVLLWGLSGWIGRIWFASSAVPPDVIARCLELMGLAAALRWLAGLHRAALVGLERQRRVVGLSAGFATLRFVGVLPLLMYISTSPVAFFVYQVGVSALELTFYALAVNRQLPHRFAAHPGLDALKTMLPMVGSMAYLSGIWTVVTQLDKLVLSGILPLREYGYFTLAAMAASGVLILVPPLGQVVQPRLTILAEHKNDAAFAKLYLLASQLAVVAFVSLGGGLAFFAEPILRIWSGNAIAAQAAAPILFWYGLANAVVGVLVLPFMMQFAKGQLRLHTLGTSILAAVLAPALVFGARHWGGEGAGLVLFVANVLFLIVWIPFVHSRFIPEMTWRWSLVNTFPLALLLISIFLVSSGLRPVSLSPFSNLAWIGSTLIVAIASGIVVGNETRRFFWSWLLEIKNDAAAPR